MKPSPEEIIDDIYSSHPEARKILLAHSRAVADKAVLIARGLGLPEDEILFIREAAMLHDVGIIRTNAPMLGCTGELPYICHGVEGRLMLEARGLPLHALVCERHVGVGLTPDDIRRKGFPLPERDMLPLSLPEQIVCIADKFFSKLGQVNEKPMEKVRAEMEAYGEDKLREFDRLCVLLGLC